MCKLMLKLVQVRNVSEYVWNFELITMCLSAFKLLSEVKKLKIC